MGEVSEAQIPIGNTNGNRSRALTTSSYASTAIPPRVESELDLGSSDFGSSFDDMFSNFNKRQSTAMDSAGFSAVRSDSEPAVAAPARSLVSGRRNYQPEPLQLDRSLRVEPSPISWDSRDSNERLMASPTEYQSESRPPPVPPHTYITTPTPTAEKYGAPRASGKGTLRSSSSFEDEDAKVVRDSFVSRNSFGNNANSAENSVNRKPTSTSSSSAISLQTPMSSRSTSNNTTPKAQPRLPENPQNEEEESLFTNAKAPAAPRATARLTPQDEEDKPLFDPATIASANAARKFAESAPARRIMREDQFRKQKQLSASQPAVEESNSETSEDDYDDEDEAKVIQQQQELRRKQERQLQMNREIMRKTTANGDSNRPGSRAESPALNGSSYPPEMFINRTDDWEDEDVPLGILKEHGFPTQARPPTRPTDATPSYTRRQNTLPDRPASAGANAGPVARSSLPPFAKNLPADPYFGASLVRPTNRESLAFGGNNMFPPSGMGMGMGPGSVYGGSGAAPVPPGGLIGVIQEEERAKKVRRASPGSTYGYGQSGPLMQGMQMRMPPVQPQMSPMHMQQFQQMQQQLMYQQMMGNQMGFGMMQPQGQMNTVEFAAAVAKEMLAMQNQIQQMNMGGVGGMPGMQMGMPQQSSFLSPHGQAVQRPMSIASNAPGGPQQRTMSMLAPPTQWGSAPVNNYTPSVHNFHPVGVPGYTPSLAPSERSNVGLASRYRPVVNQHADGTSSVSSVTLQASGGAADTKGKDSKVKGILKKGKGQNEDDEEASWSSLRSRRNKWGIGKKGSSEPTLKDLYYDDA